MFIDKWDRKKVGEEKKVKEKQVGGERQGQGAQGSRRDWGCLFQTTWVQKITLPTFRLNAPVVIRTKVKEVRNNVAIYSHALLRIRTIGGQRSVRIAPSSLPPHHSTPATFRRKLTAYLEFSSRMVIPQTSSGMPLPHPHTQEKADISSPEEEQEKGPMGCDTLRGWDEWGHQACLQEV